MPVLYPVFDFYGMIGTTFVLCWLGFMNSVDAPVCVVKRFRRHVPTALETPPAPASQHGFSTGSFELVSGGSDSPEALFCPDQDALSSIAPVDLFCSGIKSRCRFSTSLDGFWEL